jgi:hypothetical protein
VGERVEDALQQQRGETSAMATTYSRSRRERPDTFIIGVVQELLISGPLR